MKMYSADAVTKSDIDAIDEKQMKQIKQLRIALAVAFVMNASLTLALYFIR